MGNNAGSVVFVSIAFRVRVVSLVHCICILLLDVLVYYLLYVRLNSLSSFALYCFDLPSQWCLPLHKLSNQHFWVLQTPIPLVLTLKLHRSRLNYNFLVKLNVFFL